MSRKTYRGSAIDVSFDPKRCLHAAECVRGLPSVFDVKARPWIDPDGAAADAIAEVVRRCPSGALHYELPDGERELPDGPARVRADEGGPLWMRGELRLETAEGELAETRAALCSCGQSETRPFCDGSGPCTGWRRAGD